MPGQEPPTQPTKMQVVDSIVATEAGEREDYFIPLEEIVPQQLEYVFDPDVPQSLGEGLSTFGMEYTIFGCICHYKDVVVVLITAQLQ